MQSMVSIVSTLLASDPSAAAIVEMNGNVPSSSTATATATDTTVHVSIAFLVKVLVANIEIVQNLDIERPEIVAGTRKIVFRRARVSVRALVLWTTTTRRRRR
mmetsp:Transcript_10276/g.22008  ORF Transcript_10276/g.22008 Transcript_10276/m.22008 type:complete len:103 (+) Transcript_10276:47-355(+)